MVINRIIQATAGVLYVSSSFAVGGMAMEDCQQIKDRSERYSCYDGVEAKPSSISQQHIHIPEKVDTSTPIQSRQAQELAQQSNWFSITPHKPNYILPVTYNADADYSQYGRYETLFSDMEAKFQISLKSMLWSDMFAKSSLWFAYTQVSFWQLYADDEASAPFRETNHEPEILWQFPVGFDFLNTRAQLFTLALNHQSNGRSEPLSRSWNRITGELAFQSDDFVWSVKSWYRIKEEKKDDNNPDIEDYMGRIELGAAYQLDKHTIAVGIKNNLQFESNRSGIELNWSVPVSRHLKLFTQLYSGYGENLIDQENYTNRIGVGLALSDWL